MALEDGTKVKIIAGSNEYHYFLHGDIVEFVRTEAFGGKFKGTVYNWDYGVPTNPKEDTQYLLARHYVVVSDDVELSGPKEMVFGEIPEKKVDPSLPKKSTYAVVLADGTVFDSYISRDTARDIKFALGGKAKGVKIFAYSAQKEIR